MYNIQKVHGAIKDVQSGKQPLFPLAFQRKQSSSRMPRHPTPTSQPRPSHYSSPPSSPSSFSNYTLSRRRRRRCLPFTEKLLNPLISFYSLTHDFEPGRGAQPPAGHVLGHAGVVGGVHFIGLHHDQVAVGHLQVAGISPGPNFDAVLQPIQL